MSWGADRIDIVLGGGGNSLYQKVYDGTGGGWSGWNFLGGTLTSDPTISSQASGELDIYARNGSNGLSSLHFGSSYSGWSSWQDRGSLSSPNGSAPAVNSFATGTKIVYFREAYNQLYYRMLLTPTSTHHTSRGVTPPRPRGEATPRPVLDGRSR